MASECQIDDCISFDIGGTSSDICLIRHRRPEWTVEATIGGSPVRLPMMDVHTVGAGGSSIIWVDPGGSLRVGPGSARSNPGPACWGFGGTQPTVTDAHMEVGSLRAEFFADKDIPFAPVAGTAALGALGAVLGLRPIEVAVGALQVVNHKLSKEIRAAALARGLETSDFTLIPFGGAGQLHACAVAELISISRVLLPDAAGVLSALGAAIADYRYDFSQGLVRRTTSIDADDLARIFARLEEQGRERLGDFPVQQIRMERSIDLRYVGQSFEINAPATINGNLLPIMEIVADFHQRHASTYGFCDTSEPVEVVSLRLSAFGETPKPRRERTSRTSAGSDGEKAPVHGPEGTTLYQLMAREALFPGEHVTGPAILYDPYATALVPPGWSGAMDRAGHILLIRK